MKFNFKHFNLYTAYEDNVYIVYPTARWSTISAKRLKAMRLVDIYLKIELF